MKNVPGAEPEAQQNQRSDQVEPMHDGAKAEADDFSDGRREPTASADPRRASTSNRRTREAQPANTQDRSLSPSRKLWWTTRLACPVGERVGLRVN